MARDWQKSFLKIPAEVLASIESLESDEFVVSAVRVIERDRVAEGDFAHLGIDFDGAGDIEVPDQFLPEDEVGPWARRNRTEGWAKKFKELPKVTKSWSVETPNFGDWSKGSHTTTFSQEVYQKHEFGAPGWTFSMALLEEDGDSITVEFELDPIFDREGYDEWELFFALNVFQESDRTNRGEGVRSAPRCLPPHPLRRLGVPSAGGGRRGHPPGRRAPRPLG